MHFIIWAILGSQGLFASENYPLNWKYRGGSNLIYDCINKYYACVNEISSDRCHEERAKAIENKLDKYPCAVLKSFAKKEDCLRKNYEVLNANTVKKFCYLDWLHH